MLSGHAEVRKKEEVVTGAVRSGEVQRQVSSRMLHTESQLILETPPLFSLHEFLQQNSGKEHEIPDNSQ